MKKSYLEVKARLIAEKILQAKHFIVLTGAGISTESGIPDYRGDNGRYKIRAQGKEVKVKPLEEFKPNPAHYALVRLQDLGLIKFIISQNIDGLHIKSGIKKSIIAEIHGNYSILKCIECDSRFTKKEMKWDNKKYGWGARSAEPSPEQPKCPICGGRLISSIVNFREPMPEKEMKLAKEHSKKCDLMLVIGTSLRVSPANTLPRIAEKNGSEVFIINLKPTGLDNILKNERIKAKAGEILPLIVDYVEEMIKNSS
ncbi:MAG: Sir2 family NAD-dependent protein deacetylase [Candidatus Heimdallarchaeum endolithica]|uniref:Sir2 family NAD-dependent protein deacetylase n=1 Tax=Candidatus Heimdallarchaeum endolithica TaxID=2876572 RepID=A0A9Y1FNY8_9ARCH|nr:MAG: Sir2 family NAD-dependent protein deacetylase [Candidatus Heimdallarchaeum endolithica]